MTRSQLFPHLLQGMLIVDVAGAVRIATVGTSQQSALQGSSKEKHQHDIFDNTGAHDAANFYRSLKHIAYHLQLSCGNKISEAIHTMTPVNIVIPSVPTGQPDPNNPTGQTLLPVSDIDIYLWKEQHKKASAKFDKYVIDMARAYIKHLPSMHTKPQEQT